MEHSPTATSILDAAQELAQTRGYNAFSYRDLAERVGIRTASIHYHFPSKADLGRAMVARYREFVGGALSQIDVDVTDLPLADAAPERLRRYAALLESVLTTGNRVCLGGMLASDYATLPLEMQREVVLFISENEAWLTRRLREGRAAGSLSFSGAPEAAAATYFAALEGAMFVSRSCQDPERYRRTSAWLLGALVTNAVASSSP